MDFASSAIDIIKKVLVSMLKLPFNLWYSTPYPIKIAIYVIIIGIMAIILTIIIKNRDKYIRMLY